MSEYGYLPSTARDLADLIGIDDTLEIMRVYGGHPLNIPYKATPGLLLASVISPESLDKLCKNWGGVRIYHVPTLAKVSNRQRDRAIFDAHEAGESISSLAVRYKLCTRWVNKIIAKQRLAGSAENQLDLFHSPSPAPSPAIPALTWLPPRKGH